MEYREARAYINEAGRFGHEMGLEPIRALLEEMGNPQDDLKFIHIAGTNGKGSINAHIASVLKRAGYRVGRFVSPTLYGYRERIQINDEWIEKQDFADCMEKTWEAVQRMMKAGKACPSPFEIETALSFLYFREKKCDFVVLECGMGGATDATNIIKHTVVSILASVSLDHMEYLGDTLEAITETKAGILKPGAVMVTGRQKTVVTDTLKRICLEKGNPLVIADPDEAEVLVSTIDEQRFTYHGLDIKIRLSGKHQIDNAVIAIEALLVLGKLGCSIPREAIQDGMAATEWNGRFSRIHTAPDVIVDGAHNPDAAFRLKQALLQYYPDKRLVFIMGIYKDKQVDKIAEIMAPMASQIYAIETPKDPRALPAKELTERILVYNKHVETCDSIPAAVKKACEAAGKEGVVVSFGSFSFIGTLTRICKEYFEK